MGFSLIMENDGVHIRDINSLEELNNMIEYSGEALANIEENVSNYIDGVQDVLIQQLSIIQEKLDEAKERLSDAEDALSSCLSSQEYDEESHTYHPSCSWQESAVQRARKEVDEWQRKYDAASRIVSECESEISEYNEPGGVITPPGGHYLIVDMRERQLVWATEQLRDYIDKAKEALNLDLGGDSSSGDVITNPYIREEDLPRSEDDKRAAFINAVNGVREEQRDFSEYRDFKNANRAMRCPRCGKPLALCTCNNLHADVHLYKQ